MSARLTTRRVVLVLAVVLIAVGLGSVAKRTFWGSSCGAERLDDPRSPLQSAEVMRQRPNADRDKLVAAVDAMAAPFGPVEAGLDYYYDQYLRAYGVPGGILTRTKDNAPFTYLDDETLEPRWSLRPTSQRTAWDASVDRFLVLNLEDRSPITIGSFDLGSGKAVWCVEVDAAHRDGDPVATTFLDGGDVVAALPDGTDIALIRLKAKDGEQDWSRVIPADRADYLGALDERLLVVGGSEESRLTDPAAEVTATPAISGVDAQTGEVAWTWSDQGKGPLHVVGVIDGSVVVMVRTDRGTELVGVSGAGKETWRTGLFAGGREATLRGDVVLVRSTEWITAYDARGGHRLWATAIPTDKPYIPLGFTLSQMPSVDADHLLVPTVSSLDLFDLTDGLITRYRMPTDGLSSAYFPYQLLVTEKHLGVVANTGAALAGRE